MVAPNSPSARAQQSAAPARGGDQGQRHPPEARPRTRTEGRGCVLVALVDLADAGLDRDDEEGHGDERLGEHRAGGGERQGHPGEPVERLTDEAAAAEGEQEGHPADHRRQDHRQGHQRADDRAAGEGDPGENPRQGHPQRHRQRHRRDRALQRQAQRRPHVGGEQLGAHLRPRRALEQADERKHDQRHRPPRRDQEAQRRPPLPHGPRKPRARSAFCPSPETISSTNARAALRCVLAFTTAIG